MKNILILTALAVLSAFSSRGQCPNGDFEAGVLSPPWTCYINTTPSTGILDPTAFMMVPSSPRHTITNVGFNDPVVGSPLPQVAAGNHAVRLGDANVGAQSEILSYTFTLTSDFSFNYALVFENPHTGTDNPFFSYWISLTDNLPTSTLSGNLLATDEYRATSSPFYTALPSGVIYRPWTTECVMAKFPSLSAYVGQIVTIYFATADCAPGAHYGYAYIDDLCKSTSGGITFSAPTSIGHIAGYPLTVTATSTVGIIDYYFSATPCNSAGVPLGGPVDITTTHTGPLPAGVDIRPWFPPTCFVMTTYYLVTLHVRTVAGCSTYSDLSQVVYVN